MPRPRQPHQGYIDRLRGHGSLQKPSVESAVHAPAVRGQKVMIDSDLAQLYQLETKTLNKAVARNLDRFPEDFMFRLSKEEFDNLRLQIGTSSSGYGGRRYLPYAFTEHGVAMLSSILNSSRAVQMNILIIRAFIKMKDLLATHKDLAARVEKLETNQRRHGSVIAVGNSQTAHRVPASG